MQDRYAEALYRALLSAFPSRETLERMLRFGMGLNLADVASGNLSDQVYGVIKFAEARSLVTQLIHSALTANPDNVELRAVAELPHQIQDASPAPFVVRSGDAARNNEAISGVCPYPGLLHFTDDQKFPFFGRDGEIRDGLTTLFKARFLAVIGRTGSGKSSLVLAGIVPRWRQVPQGEESPAYVYMRPGANPMAALNEASAKIETTAGGKALLVIDQLEELFTHGREVQHAVAGGIEDIVGNRRCSVIVTARADFYPDLMELPVWPLISRNRLEVLPLSGDRLRAALVEPAAARGVTLDAVLLDRLVNATAAEPGSLPFVQLVMQELWNKQRDRTIPLEPYEELGGLQAAAARCANDAYLDLERTWRLDEKAQGATTVRRLFVRLVDVARDGRETRRQQTVAELQRADSDHLFNRALSHFIDRRLLVSSVQSDGASGADTFGDRLRRIDLAHESLITAWSMLRDWLTEVRDIERRLRELANTSSVWIKTRAIEPRRGLLDSYELADAEATIANGKELDLDPGDLVAAFVEASRAEVQRQAAAAAEAQRRELEIAQREVEVQTQIARSAEQQLTINIERELAIAAEIQHALLPKPLVSLDFVEAASASIPCRSIGGDYFDYLDDHGQLYFTLGDVAGKGPPAALMSAVMQGMMLLSDLAEGPAAVVDHMNKAVCRRGLESRFVTLMIGTITATGELTYCNAGHNPPLLVGMTGVRHLETGGPVVGMFESARYSEEVLQLEPGDVVVIFSDGLSEGLNNESEAFGEERIQTILEQNSNATPQELVDLMLAGLRAFSQEAPQSDDISLMVVRYRGLSSTP